MIFTTEDNFFEHDCNATLYTFRLENFSNHTNKNSQCLNSSCKYNIFVKSVRFVFVFF